MIRKSKNARYRKDTQTRSLNTGDDRAKQQSSQLEEPLNLAAGTRVTIIIESVLPNEIKSPKTFLETAQSLQLQGEPDWSEKIDQYLSGETIDH